MIRIIEPGKTTYTIKCTQCECTYAYELGDILTGGTYCPCCDEFNLHSARIEQADEKIKEVYQNGIEAILNATVSYGDDSFCKVKDCPDIDVSIKCPHMITNNGTIRKGGEK